jgi:hypothetical protein
LTGDCAASHLLSLTLGKLFSPTQLEATMTGGTL